MFTGRSFECASATAIAEITREARVRCQAIGEETLEAVEALRAEVEKNPALGRPARSAIGDMRLCTPRLEATDKRPALTVTHVYDAPPPEPGLIRIALVSPVRFAGGGTGF